MTRLLGSPPQNPGRFHTALRRASEGRQKHLILKGVGGSIQALVACALDNLRDPRRITSGTTSGENDAVEFPSDRIGVKLRTSQLLEPWTGNDEILNPQAESPQLVIYPSQRISR